MRVFKGKVEIVLSVLYERKKEEQIKIPVLIEDLSHEHSRA